MQRSRQDESQLDHSGDIHHPSDAARPIACNLTDAQLATRLDSLREELFAGADERRELKDGYAFRFPGEGDWGVKLADFITSERQCCPFFRFELTFEPDLGPIWLNLTGPNGVKDFIAAMMEAGQNA